MGSRCNPYAAPATVMAQPKPDTSQLQFVDGAEGYRLGMLMYCFFRACARLTPYDASLNSFFDVCYLGVRCLALTWLLRLL